MFPYIRQIKVNNCYTYQNFLIANENVNAVKHFVLTGKNGSGKTTILNRIGFLINSKLTNGQITTTTVQLKNLIDENPNSPQFDSWKKRLSNFQDVELIHHFTKEDFETLLSPLDYLVNNREEYIFSYFKANRKVNLQNVESVKKESDFLKQINGKPSNGAFVNQFKQYLVNKKVYEAFDHMKAKNDSIQQSIKFFDDFTQTLRNIFGDKGLELEFVQEEFEFYLNLSDGQRITFNQLSEGFSAFLTILMDLLMRTDLIRKQKKDFSFNPPGIVLIDEPETHFHLEMQYEIMPLLTTLFPKIQFIVATHSPAVISSIENAIVYDLSSKRTIEEEAQGSSFSELMVSHFVLDNEFSPIADKLLDEISAAYKNGNSEKLKDLQIEYEHILTPSLRLEIESRIIDLESKELIND